MRDVKRQRGATDGARLHCRELFAKDARARSSWAHLTDEQTFAMYGEIAQLISDGSDWHRSVCIARKSDFNGPAQHWRQTDGAAGTPPEIVREVAMSDKWIEAQCSLGASIHLTHSPSVEIEFIADSDRTQIDSYEGSRQASSLLGGQIHHDNGRKYRVTPTIHHAAKCELLEVADFCAYTAQRYWHLKSGGSARAAHWGAWYESFNFMLAHYEVAPSGQFAINVKAHTRSPRRN